jgi:putative transposase
MNSVNYRNINEHGVGDNKYHLEWCPKYRWNAMRSPYIAEEMKQIFLQIATEKGIVVHKLVVDSDHVHMFVSLPLWMSVSTALQYLKGISAYKIFRSHPDFRKRYRKGAFWSPGHFSRSVSNVTESAVEHYIDKHEYPKFLPEEEGRQMKLRFN